jgi:hypothetical protein
MSQAWISCKIGDGMFPGEVSVFLVTSDGRELSMFIQENSSDFLRGGSVDAGWISGAIKNISAMGHFAYVRLCQETLEGVRCAWFSVDALRYVDEDAEEK